MTKLQPTPPEPGAFLGPGIPPDDPYYTVPAEDFEMVPEFREDLVSKLVKCLTERYKSSISEEEVQSILCIVQEIEEHIYKTAESASQYYDMLAEDVFKAKYNNWP